MNVPDLKKRLSELRALFPVLRLSDSVRLKRELDRAASALGGKPETAEHLVNSLSFQVRNALKRSIAKTADELHYEFPEDLPIVSHVQAIQEKLRSHPVVIVCGSTGSGKTTQLPKIALSAGLGRVGRIGCTQPRRIAASSLARRVAGELSCECGAQVGYKVRFDDRTAENTVVKFMTDGILLAETRDDPMLYQYDCIILDEVHERSLNIDFLLGYLKLLLKKRTDLKLIISSATLESERISAFFDHAPVEEVEGRLFPIEDCYLEPEEDEELAETVARGISFLDEIDRRGDILVFLPGEREIRDCAELLKGRNFPNTEILPLFGRLSAGDQQRVFSPSRFRRIVLATNVAETSLTIPGIRYVVDSGLVRLSRYNPRTRIQELRVETISQASARQRRGRCGRLRDGVCVHLYSEEVLNESAEFTPPEIQRSSLAGVILQMASLGLPPLGEFPLVDEPSPALVREGMRALNDLRALNGTCLTPIGRKLAAMPLDPHLGKMLLEADRHRLLSELLVIVAFLSIPDPRERPFEKASEADAAHRKFASDKSDFIGILNLWLALEEEFRNNRNSNQALRRFTQKNYLNYRRVREWRNLADDLREICAEAGCTSKNEINPERLPYDVLHKVLLSGLPRQLGCYNRETRLYSDMGGKKFLLFPGSGLAKRKSPPDCVLSFALVETTRVFARCNAEARAEWLEQIAPHLCAYVYDNVYWDDRSGFVYARERVTAGQLVIHPGRRCHYGKTHPKEAREVFLREGLVSGAANLRGSWLEESSYLIRELRLLELKIRRPDSLIDEVALYDWFDRSLPPEICSVDAVKRLWNVEKKSYSPPPEEFTTESYAELKESDYPDFLVFAGQRFSLSYRYDPGENHDGITLLAREDSLNLLSPYVLDYLVPGYLPQKIELMIRSLPKNIRVELMPIADAVDSFMERYRAGEIFTEQPLASALADFLLEEYGVELEHDAFDRADPPEYLQMKLAILNEHGKVREIARTFPDVHRLDSCLSTNIPAVKKWDMEHCRCWPGISETLPYSITVSKESGTLGYPAVVAEEESVGRKVFLKEREAKLNHERGLLMLYRMEMPVLVKHMRSALKVPHDLELSFFLNDPQWRDELIDSAVRESFPVDCWDIRSAGDFAQSVEHSRDCAAELLAKKLTELKSVFALYEEAVALKRRLPRESDCAYAIEERLELLFRKGFLRCRIAFSRYDRYLKALKIRVERALTAPAKDAQKGADLDFYASKLKLALEVEPDLERNEELCEFYLLFEEANINRYAPEIRTLEKCGPEVLKRKWEAVRL